MYLASPNCTQAGHFANQGCLYKDMPIAYRKTLFHEFQKQLNVLTELMFGASSSGSDYIIPGKLTLADVVVYTSYIFFKETSKVSYPADMDGALAYNRDTPWASWAQFLEEKHAPFQTIGKKIAEWVANTFGPSRSPAVKAAV